MDRVCVGVGISCGVVLLKGHDGIRDVTSPLEQALERGLKEVWLGVGHSRSQPACAFPQRGNMTALRLLCMQSSARFSEVTWGWEQVAGGDWLCSCGATELVLGAVPSLWHLRAGEAACLAVCLKHRLRKSRYRHSSPVTLGDCGSLSGPTVPWGDGVTAL